MITAKSLMTDSVVSVSPDSSLLDVLRVFVEENIHGAPVVDGDGQLLGVITTTDLLRAQSEEHDTVLATSSYFRDVLEFSAPDAPSDLIDFQDRLKERTVAEVMTNTFACVSCEASVADVARCLRENQVHRVWVTDESGVCGVISALDLMPVIERGVT